MLMVNYQWYNDCDSFEKYIYNKELIENICTENGNNAQKLEFNKIILDFN